MALAALLALLCACGPARVEVGGEFPTPLMDPFPVTLGVWLAQEFKNHEFVDEGKTRGDSGWIVNTGEAQTNMWKALFGGMFDTVVYLEEAPEPGKAVAGVDGILIPAIEELQYAIPKQTNVKVYEIWLRYRFRLLTAQGEGISEWSMSSYGKTPTAFLQSDERAVNLAAIMALRDAGANFVISFRKLPGVETWLQERIVLDAGQEE